MRIFALTFVLLALAVPVLGKNMDWEDLTEWSDLPPLYAPTPWPGNLQEKRVVLRWNGKHNGDIFLNRLEEKLHETFPKMQLVRAYEIFPQINMVSRQMEDAALAARLIQSLKPDLVIAATADCRACTARMAIDQVWLERAGVPTLTIVTEPFIKTFDHVCRNLRMELLPFVAVPHPVAIISGAKLEAKVRQAFLLIVKMLIGNPPEKK